MPFVLASTLAIGGLVVLAVLPLLRATELLRREALDQAHTAANLSAHHVDQQLLTLVEITEAYAAQTTLQRALQEASANGQAFDDAEVRAVLDDLLGAIPGVHSVFVADWTGVVRMVEPADPNVLDTDLGLWEQYRSEASDSPQADVGTLLWVRPDTPSAITVTARIRATRWPGQPRPAVGVLGANYDVTKSLQQLVDDLQAHERLRLTITDSEGTVVAAPDGDPSAGSSLRDEPGTAAALNGTARAVERRVGGKPVAVGYAPVENTGWTVRTERTLVGKVADRSSLLAFVVAAALTLGVPLIVSFAHLARALRAQRRAEREAQQSEQRVRSILAAASDAYIGTEGGQSITEWNTAAEALFGWQREEVVGRRLSDVVELREPDAEDRLSLDVASLCAGPREASGVDRWGRHFPVEVAAWLSGDANGASECSMFVRDITARRRIQEQLATARDQAMKASALKSEFLANMSHEIRTPLSGVIGLSQLLLDTELTNEQREYAESMVDAAEHLLSVIGDILDVSRLEAGKLELEPTPFAPRALLAGVQRVLQVPAESKGLELTTEVDTAVPPALVGDVGRLRQILLNLAGNAIKFTERGRVGLRMACSSTQPHVLRFEVADTGPGIPASEIPALFEPFRQGDASTARSHGGSGLGLSIIQRLVALMDGKFGVRSFVGRGSTFWVEVPLGQPSDRQAELLGQQAVRPTTLRLVAADVLVVEDNELNQRLALAMLRKLGCRPQLAASGAEALALLARQPVDLVLMDCNMPGMDGFETTERLRQLERDERHTVVVAMTASATTEDRQRCLRAGMDDYLAKPVRQRDLDRILRRWIDDHEEPPASARAPAHAIPSDELDSTILMELRAALGEGGVATSLRQFSATVPAQLDQLSEALARDDVDAALSVAHSLKGYAASMGAARLASECADLEWLIKADLSRSAEALAQLYDSFDAATSALRRRLAM